MFLNMMSLYIYGKFKGGTGYQVLFPKEQNGKETY